MCRVCGSSNVFLSVQRLLFVYVIIILKCKACPDICICFYDYFSRRSICLIVARFIIIFKDEVCIFDLTFIVYRLLQHRASVASRRWHVRSFNVNIPELWSPKCGCAVFVVSCGKFSKPEVYRCPPECWYRRSPPESREIRRTSIKESLGSKSNAPDHTEESKTITRQ